MNALNEYHNRLIKRYQELRWRGWCSVSESKEVQELRKHKKVQAYEKAVAKAVAILAPHEDFKYSTLEIDSKHKDWQSGIESAFPNLSSIDVYWELKELEHWAKLETYGTKVDRAKTEEEKESLVAEWHHIDTLFKLERDEVKEEKD